MNWLRFFCSDLNFFSHSKTNVFSASNYKLYFVHDSTPNVDISLNVLRNTDFEINYFNLIFEGGVAFLKFDLIYPLKCPSWGPWGSNFLSKHISEAHWPNDHEYQVLLKFILKEFELITLYAYIVLSTDMT